MESPAGVEEEEEEEEGGREEEEAEDEAAAAAEEGAATLATVLLMMNGHSCGLFICPHSLHSLPRSIGLTTDGAW